MLLETKRVQLPLIRTELMEGHRNREEWVKIKKRPLGEEAGHEGEGAGGRWESISRRGPKACLEEGVEGDGREERGAGSIRILTVELPPPDPVPPWPVSDPVQP